MELTSSYIYIRNARMTALHGVMPQENSVGGEYELSLRVGYDVSRAAQSDDVSHTLDYASLYQIAKREMEQPSALIENVAHRIAVAIERNFTQATSIDICLTKVNPPMGADCDGAGVELHYQCG